MDEHVLRDLATKANEILLNELANSGTAYDHAEARTYNIKTVGVQGDNRTYGHVIEIEVTCQDNRVWTPDLLARISTRITNEIKGVNRVAYVLA